MADPRDYIMQAGMLGQQGISAWQDNKKQEEFLNTELHPDLQSAFMPAPRPQVGMTKFTPEASAQFDSALGGATSGFAGLAQAGQTPPSVGGQTGMEHPEIKKLAKLVEQGMDPLVAAQQARKFTNRDMPAIKLAMDAREQQARGRQLDIQERESQYRQSQPKEAPLTFEQQLQIARERGMGPAEARADASKYGADKGLEGRKYGADRGLEGAKIRAKATVDAARERALASERIATQRFGSKNSYVSDAIKTLKVKADALGKAGVQLDMMRNVDENGINGEELKQRREEYDDALKKYNEMQTFVDELLETPQQSQPHGSSTVIDRNRSTARVDPPQDWRITQKPGQPPPPGAENATPVPGALPREIQTAKEVVMPPPQNYGIDQPSSGTTRQGRAVSGQGVSVPVDGGTGPQYYENPKPGGFQPPPAPKLDGVGDVITRVAFSAKTNTTYFFSGNRVVKTVPGRVK
jgi:hypothetical protein